MALVINSSLTNCIRQTVLQNNLKLFNVFTCKCVIHTSSIRFLFFESDPKGEYASLRPKYTRRELLRDGLKVVKDEIKVWRAQITEKFNTDNLLKGIPGVVDRVFEFKTEENINQWVVTCDKDNLEGESFCQLTTNQNGKGIFNGNLCLDLPNDGEVTKSGYCNIRTARLKKAFQQDACYEWGMYTHLVMRVRGDGRSYGIHLSTSGFYDVTWNDMYTYVLFTRGGPYWQYSRIPFSKFFFTSKGRIQDIQYPVPLNRVSSVGITLAERAPGPFYLEIDYIGLEYDPLHTESFAYEMYKLPVGIASS